MNRFTWSEMEMLTEGGWEGCFVEDIEEGDEVALKAGWTSDDDAPPIKFVAVENLKRIPRYERDMFGSVRHEATDFLIQFIGVHADSGVREPMGYGSGFAAFRRSPVREGAA